ncbi:MAG: hypothetical protein U0586_02425 [Candidatus Brocadiaceae bacterium]
MNRHRVLCCLRLSFSRKTYEEAVANIKEAIEGWLETMESKHTFTPECLVEVTV